MIINNTPTINLNKTSNEVEQFEPPIVKLTKLCSTTMTMKTKMNEDSVHQQESIEGQNSTAIGSSRKNSYQMDNSQCSQCSELVCLNSLCGDCAFNNNLLNDAASNLSEAMSSIENSSQIDADEISEVWELSSICTENSLKSKKPKKIVKYLHIKCMTTQDYCVEEPPMNINDVLPLFAQIEKSSRLSEIKSTIQADYDRAVIQCLLICQEDQVLQRLRDSQLNSQLSSINEETKCGGNFRSSCGYLNTKQRKAFKGASKLQRIGEEQEEISCSRGGVPSCCIIIPQQLLKQQETVWPASNQTTIIEEEDQKTIDPLQGSLPVEDHFREEFKPPGLQRQQAMIFISFMLMNQKVLESAKKRATRYLTSVPRSSQNYNAMLCMVTEVYRILLLPEQALTMYISCLTEQQRVLEGQVILHNLHSKVNKHQNLHQAVEKVRKFYKI